MQLDELYAKVRGVPKALWLWLAIDPQTKIFPALHLGARRTVDAMAFIHDLKLRLTSDCIPAFTSDGLRAYFYALTAHFSEPFRPPHARKTRWWVSPQLLYDQLLKQVRRRKLVCITTRMLCGARPHLQRVLQTHRFSPRIQTPFIERVNLTLRQGIVALTRRTWSLPQSPEMLLLHTEWWRLYYHFARPHTDVRVCQEGNWGNTYTLLEMPWEYAHPVYRRTTPAARKGSLRRAQVCYIPSEKQACAALEATVTLREFPRHRVAVVFGR